MVHHNSSIAPGRRDRPQWQLTEAAVKDEEDEMKCAHPWGLSLIHLFHFRCSSLVRPPRPSSTPSCLWLIPLIRLIKLNVNLGQQDWWRTGGRRGQGWACCGAAVMMTNGVLSRNCAFSQWASGGRPGFRFAMQSWYCWKKSDIKKLILVHLWWADKFYFYCIIEWYYSIGKF